MIDSLAEGEKRSVKGLLTQDQLIPGPGNAMAQDILFWAGLHPRHPINPDQRKKLFKAIVNTVHSVIDHGGRYDEYDLFNQAGKYVRIMDIKTADLPCPQSGTAIEKIQYLGGACYFCPNCQK